MSRDEIVAALLVASFAILVTAHAMLVLALLLRRPRWRALLALAAPPFAPWCGWREGMKARALAWVVGACGYVVTLWLASR